MTFSENNRMILIVDTSSSKTLSNKAQCDITVLPEIPSTTMDDNESVYLPQQNLNLNGRNVISISGFDDEKSSSYLLAISSCHASEHSENNRLLLLAADPSTFVLESKSKAIMSVQVQFMMSPILHQAGRDISIINNNNITSSSSDRSASYTPVDTTDTEIQLLFKSFFLLSFLLIGVYIIAAYRIVCSPPSSSSQKKKPSTSPSSSVLRMRARLQELIDRYEHHRFVNHIFTPSETETESDSIMIEPNHQESPESSSNFHTMNTPTTIATTTIVTPSVSKEENKEIMSTISGTTNFVSSSSPANSRVIGRDFTQILHDVRRDDSGKTEKEIHLEPLERTRTSSASYSEDEKRENRNNALSPSSQLSLSQLSIPTSFSFLYDDDDEEEEESKRDHHDAKNNSETFNDDNNNKVIPHSSNTVTSMTSPTLLLPVLASSSLSSSFESNNNEVEQQDKYNSSSPPPPIAAATLATAGGADDPISVVGGVDVNELNDQEEQESYNNDNEQSQQTLQCKSSLNYCYLHHTKSDENVEKKSEEIKTFDSDCKSDSDCETNSVSNAVEEQAYEKVKENSESSIKVIHQTQEQLQAHNSNNNDDGDGDDYSKTQLNETANTTVAHVGAVKDTIDTNNNNNGKPTNPNKSNDDGSILITSTNEQQHYELHDDSQTLSSSTESHSMISNTAALKDTTVVLAVDYDGIIACTKKEDVDDESNKQRTPKVNHNTVVSSLSSSSSSVKSSTSNTTSSSSFSSSIYTEMRAKLSSPSPSNSRVKNTKEESLKINPITSVTRMAKTNHHNSIQSSVTSHPLFLKMMQQTTTSTNASTEISFNIEKKEEEEQVISNSEETDTDADIEEESTNKNSNLVCLPNTTTMKVEKKALAPTASSTTAIVTPPQQKDIKSNDSKSVKKPQVVANTALNHPIFLKARNRDDNNENEKAAKQQQQDFSSRFITPVKKPSDTPPLSPCSKLAKEWQENTILRKRQGQQQKNGDENLIVTPNSKSNSIKRKLIWPPPLSDTDSCGKSKLTTTTTTKISDLVGSDSNSSSLHLRNKSSNSSSKSKSPKDEDIRGTQNNSSSKNNVSFLAEYWEN